MLKLEERKKLKDKTEDLNIDKKSFEDIFMYIISVLLKNDIRLINQDFLLKIKSVLIKKKILRGTDGVSLSQAELQEISSKLYSMIRKFLKTGI